MKNILTPLGAVLFFLIVAVVWEMVEFFQDRECGD